MSTRQRGRLVRAVAEREHVGAFGHTVTVTRGTLDRWIRAYRPGRCAALAPAERDVVPRTPAEVLNRRWR